MNFRGNTLIGNGVIMSTDVYLEFRSKEFVEAQNACNWNELKNLRNNESNHYFFCGRLGHLSNFVCEFNSLFKDSLHHILRQGQQGEYAFQINLSNIRDEFLIMYRHIYLYAHMSDDGNDSSDLLSPSEVEEMFDELEAVIGEDSMLCHGYIRVD